MCGLIAFVSSERTWTKHKSGAIADGQNKERFFKQGLIIDTLRGDDSTGVFYVPQENTDKRGEHETAGWLKSLGDGYSFVTSKDYKELIVPAMSTSKYMVGHNRAATQGKVNVNNAHPFQEGAITLVHNGTLYTTDSLEHSQKSLGVAVDSHAICHNLALAEPTPAGVKSVIEKLEGAFALIWHDARNDTLNIVRNSERGLYRAKAKYYSTVYFSSEKEMLELLMVRNNIAFDNIEKVKAGTYYQYKGAELVHTSECDLDEYAPVYSNYYGKTWGNNYVITPTPKSLPAPEGYVLPPPPAGKTHVSALLELELTQRDKLQFVYDKKDVHKRKTMSVTYGFIGGTKMQAEVQDVGTGLMMQGQPVCVTPVGVRVIGNDTIVLCRFFSGVWSEDMYYRECFAVQEEDEDEEEYEDGDTDDLDEVLFFGHNNRLLTFAEWTHATRDGCCVCSAPADVLDSGEMEWYSDRDYVCPKCVETFDCRGNAYEN